MPPKSRRSVKNPMILCNQCKLEVIEEEEDSIQCDKCSKTYHSLCCMLDKRQYEHLMSNESEEFICHLCEDGGNWRKELTLIRTKLNKLDQLDELHKSVVFLSSQFDEIVKGVASNKKKLENVEKENAKLKAELSDLKKSVKILNDNRVKNDCVVSGLENVGEKSAVDAVVDVVNNAGVDLKTEDIDDAYFVKRNVNNPKKTVVVKLASNKAKQKLMSVKPKLFENNDTKSVYINEFLSKETLELFNHAKALRTVGYRRVYVATGRIFVKRSELSKPRLIRSADDVDGLLLEAATNGKHRRLHQVAVDVEDSDDPDTLYTSP